MPNRRLTKKTIKTKEGLHPGSRKAGQLNRVNLRISKLQSEARLRKQSSSSKLISPLFFLHALSSPNPLSLPSLHALISEVYLTRHDSRISELLEERRAGRPKGKELLDLEEIRKREWAEYETGLEIPDLTHTPTTKFLYSIQTSTETNLTASHTDLLRQIRIFKNDLEEVVVTKVGKVDTMGLVLGHAEEEQGGGEDWTELGDGMSVV